MSKEYGGYRANKESLRIAKNIAKKLGIPYDEEDVKRLAEILHQVYFEEIIEKLGIDSHILFDHGAIRKVTSHVTNIGGVREHVFFDEQFDFWLFEICFLNSIATFKPFSASTGTKLLDALRATLDVFRIADLHEFNRDDMLVLNKKYDDLLKFSHDLSKAMIAFIMCHEIAHTVSDYLRPDMSVAEREFEADTLGYNYFTRVIQHPDKSSYIALQGMFLCAPVLFFKYLGLEEDYYSNKIKSKPERKGYPSPVERERNIRLLFNEVSAHDSIYLLDLLEKGLNSLHSHLL
ncbi:hypothetical protein [Seonamhaeicola sp.]|uniref:hypothetical protein n=1 Tax=Seonamhaeicola sp. TaxID=1912245 RepID=UPI002617C7A2|nr:hypothetical protein [Seonamhaeicola sp.]